MDAKLSQSGVAGQARGRDGADVWTLAICWFCRSTTSCARSPGSVSCSRRILVPRNTFLRSRARRRPRAITVQFDATTCATSPALGASGRFSRRCRSIRASLGKSSTRDQERTCGPGCARTGRSERMPRRALPRISASSNASASRRRTFAPHETRQMPVVFVIDPAIPGTCRR